MRKFVFGVASLLRSKPTLAVVKFLYRNAMISRRAAILFDPNALRKFSNFKPRSEMRVRNSGLFGARFDLDLNDHIQYWVYLDGSFDPTPPALARYFCKSPDDVYLDVGANVGTTSIPAAVLGVRTFGLEPSATVLARLFKNISLNNVPTMSIACVGAGDEDGVNASFYIPQGGNFGAASVFKTWNTDSLPPKEERAFIYKIDTICDFYDLKKICVMKLDIEGYEVPAINGARAMVERDQPVIIFEWRPDVAERSDLPDLSSVPSALPDGYVYFAVEPNRKHGVHSNQVELQFLPFDEKVPAENVVALYPSNPAHGPLLEIATRGEVLKVESTSL